MCTALAIMWLGYVPAAGQTVYVRSSQVSQLSTEQRQTARQCARRAGVRLRILKGS